MRTEQQQIIDLIEIFEYKIGGDEQDLSFLKGRLDTTKLRNESTVLEDFWGIIKQNNISTEQLQIIDLIEFLEQKIKSDEQHLSKLKQHLSKLKQNK